MKIKQIKLLNYGSIQTAGEDRSTAANSLTGYFIHVDAISFIDRADSLVGRSGLKFGIEYYLEGADKDVPFSEAVFLCRIKHPPLTNPDSNQTSTETIERKYNYLNAKNFDYYEFEYDWEVKLGKWTFQIIEKDEVLLEKTFDIS